MRSGTYTVPIPGQGPSGLSPWEYTIANLLSDAGYATSLWGKWHLGDIEGRLPNDQGFDEWWGFKNSADECGYTSYATYRAVAKVKGLEPPQIWEGRKGQKSTPVRELNMEVRPLLDELIVAKATDFIKRQAKGGKPFFTYVGLSHVHPPEQAHPDFDQTNPARLGLYADLMAEMDYRVGQVVDCVDEAGIADNTIIVGAATTRSGRTSGGFQRALTPTPGIAPDLLVPDPGRDPAGLPEAGPCPPSRRQ